MLNHVVDRLDDTSFTIVNSDLTSCGQNLRRSCSVNRKKPQRGVKAPAIRLPKVSVESRTRACK
ncbi:Uncharacterised protein [Escherichia coli]|uniref:Uncharacterized protein n=1 Tax=Escherichia coli TaxID=562 RepID=A0A376KJZ4_ECOLX|nr:Uncharacterised protein [Escherichia coli]